MPESNSDAPYLEAGQRAARQAGTLLRSWLGRTGAREKAPRDLVTEADLQSQAVIFKILMNAFPDHGFVGEEDSHPVTAASEFRWIVDPLDGTTNFVHQLPAFSVSIALERAGEVIAGIVYDPMADEMYTASRGNGAWMNGARLSASDCGHLDQALVAASFSAGVRRDSIEVLRFVEVLEVSQSVRRMGSAAINLCYLAAGKLDGYWASSVKMWDVAAGALLVREAGGVISHLDGSSFRLEDPQFVAAATDTLHDQLLATLKNAGTRT